MSGARTVPEGVERDFSLSRLTTIRTGGPAEYFARAGNVRRLERLLNWAAESGLEVGAVGSGSNLLIADAGVRGLVVKLDGQLARIEHDGSQDRKSTRLNSSHSQISYAVFCLKKKKKKNKKKMIVYETVRKIEGMVKTN